MSVSSSASHDVTELSNPEVRCLKDAVIIDRMVVRDRMIVDYYETMSEERRATSAQDAFTIGTRALASAGGSATMAALDERLEAAVRAAAKTLMTLPTTINTQIDAICQQYLGEGGAFVESLGKDLAAAGTMLAADGEVVSTMRDAIAVDVRRRVTDALGPIVEALNVNDANGPLGLMQRTLQDVLKGQAELRELLNNVAHIQAQRDASVHKGYDLEDFLDACLGELTSQLSDQLDNCSRAAGCVPGAKEGDFVSLVDPRLTRGVDARIVIEAKNRKNDTVAGLCRLLDSAKDNRGALVGIGVLTNPKAAAQPISLYGADKIIVHLPGFGTADADPWYQRTLVHMAYYVGRLQAIAMASAGPTQSLDVSCIGEHLDRLAAASSQFRNLARSFTAIETAVQKARECSERIREDIAAIATDLRDTLVSYTDQLTHSITARPDAPSNNILTGAS